MEAKHVAVIDGAHPIGNGKQKVYRFPNGFGASVVQFRGSYGSESGLWELAVVTFEGEDNDSFSITYDTPITSDVEGYLTKSDVDALLDRIAALPNTPDGHPIPAGEHDARPLPAGLDEEVIAAIAQNHISIRIVDSHKLGVAGLPEFIAAVLARRDGAA